MEIIDSDMLKEADKLKPTLKIRERKSISIDSVKFDKMMVDFQNPIKEQKKIAIKIRMFLDQKIEDEMDKTGTLSESTKRWVDSYTSMLEKLQKAIHGDKSVNLNVHAISHGDIAKKIREAR